MTRTEEPGEILLSGERSGASPFPAPTAAPNAGTIPSADVVAPGVVAVVVHRQSANATLACLASLLEHAPGTPVALVLGAKGSRENEDLRARLPQRSSALVLTASPELGEVQAADVGIDALLLAHPEVDQVLLLAANARLRPGALQAMRACAQRHPRIGAVGCRVVDRDGRTADERSLAARRLSPPAIRGRADGPSRGATEVRTDLVDAGCLLVDASALALGIRRDPNLDPDLADADLCLRLAAVGRSVWLTQSARVECDTADAVRGRFVDRCRDHVRLSRRRLSRTAFARWFALALFAHPLRWMWRGGLVKRLPAYYAGLLRGLFAAPR